MSIRIIIQKTSADQAAQVGGPVLVEYKTVLIENNEIEDILSRRGRGLYHAQVVGAEVVKDGE